MAIPSQTTLLTTLHTTLTGDAGAGGVNTLTGGRIWYQTPPQDETLPLVIYTVSADALSTGFTNDEDDCEVQIDVYSQRSSGLVVALAIAERICTLLHRQTITSAGGLKWALGVTGKGRPEIEEDAYRVMLTVHAWGGAT